MKARIVIEIEVSDETAQKIGDQPASRGYIDQELGWLTQSFDRVEIISIEETED